MPPAGSSRGKVAHGSILSDSFGGRRVNSQWQSTVRELADAIIKAQLSEIAEMKRYIADIEANGEAPAGTPRTELE